MKAAIANPLDQARLQAAAHAWLGTRYAADGAIRGAGCSCAMLPWVVLCDYGHVSPQPPARGALKKVDLEPAIVGWLDAHPESFSPIALDQIDCGDVAVLRAGICHALLAVDRRRFIHSWQDGGVQFICRDDPSIVKRLFRAWRPVVQ